MTIHVDIVSAEGSIYSGEAERVFVPGKMGELGIAPRHAPLLTTLRPGAVRVQGSDGEKAFWVKIGVAFNTSGQRWVEEHELYTGNEIVVFNRTVPEAVDGQKPGKATPAETVTW